MLDRMVCGPDAVLVVHVGGTYGDRASGRRGGGRRGGVTDYTAFPAKSGSSGTWAAIWAASRLTARGL
jgi:hypothetical protein